MGSSSRYVPLSVVAAVVLVGMAAAQPPPGIEPLGGPDRRFHPALPPPGADGPYALDFDALAPAGQRTGWFVNAGLAVLKPRLDVRITTPGPLDPSFAGPTAPPTTPLDWLGAPELTLGYRLPNATGDVQLSYRLVATQGRGTVAGFDTNFDGSPADARVRTRLNVNTIDLDYVLPEFLTPEATDTSPAYRRELRGGVGVRAATAYFDTRAAGPVTLDERASSFFWGVGPRVFLDYRQPIADRPLWAYAKVSASGLYGAIRQDFAQTGLNPDGTTTTAGYKTGRLSTGVGVGGVEAGVSWADPLGVRNLRLTAAYSWERWWSFGRTNDSFGELTLQGIILRAEFRY